MYWWLWAILGIAAIAGETVNMALFLLYVGVAAFVAAVLALAGVAAAAQIGVFLVLSVLLIALVRPRMLHVLVGRVSTQSLTNQGRMADRMAVVTQTVTPDSGMIRVGNAEFWTARTNPPTRSIEVGQQVRIVYVDGLTAYVDPTPLPVEAPHAPGFSTVNELAREER